MNDFNAWLTAKGFDPASLSETQKTALQAAWRVEQNPPAPAPAPASAPQPAPAPSSDTSFEQKVAAIDAENDRIDYIRKSTLAAMERHKGNVEQTAALRTLCDSAVGDSKVDKRAFDLALLRADRFAGPHVFSTTTPQVNSDVIEAAIAVSHRIPNAEKSFSDQTLQAAHQHFRRGVGLKRLFMMGAKANGYTGDETDFAGVCKAILRGDSHGYGYDVRSSVGPSTGIQVPGILSNIGNKSIVGGFMNSDQSWRGIAKVRPVNDFKTVTSYRMGGGNTFLRIAPSGEIKHGSLSEISYTNQAKSYGRLLGISFEDYVNDDLGAFVSVGDELGRGGAEGLNNIFWTAWLDDSTFFPTDKSKLNYDDGSTDSVLSLVGLDNAESIFALQTKPDGSVLGAMPKILLVPTALKNTALSLMNFPGLVVGTTPAAAPNGNIFAGRYQVVASPYLSRTSINDENGVAQTVTGSATAWYLLADPMDIAAIEVVFLYGKDTPTIETGDFEFDRLGFVTRATFHFGVAKQEYRAGTKLKGAT